MFDVRHGLPPFGFRMSPAAPGRASDSRTRQAPAPASRVWSKEGKDILMDRTMREWRRRGGAPGRPALWVAGMLAVSLGLLSVFGAGLPARAAGAAQLLVSAVAVDASTGAPITSLAASTAIPGVSSKIAYRVDFSCVSADCTNATVKFDPTQLDPDHNTYRLLTQSGFIPPLSGGSITGSAAAGYTVSLGTLTAGQSGQFTVQYSTNPAGCGDWNVGRDGEKTNCAVSNFPNGFPIAQTVRGNADTASGETTSTTTPVTWQIQTPTPGVTYTDMVDPNGTVVPQGGVLVTDTPYKFNVGFASGCVTGRITAYLVVDPNGSVCASDYTVTQQLPPGAELVSVTAGPVNGQAVPQPVVSGNVSTGLVLTWPAPPWTATGNTAAIGWGASNGYNSGTGGVPRVVTITFPKANLAPPDRTCNYDAHTDSPSTSASVTYISMPGTPGDVRTATKGPGVGYTVRCTDPFAKAVMDQKTSTFDGAHRITNSLSPITIPAPGGTNAKEWDVTVANQANVPGVAVVTDNALDQADAPVYQIVAPAGSSIAWTATDGTTTQSGTSTGTADAPAGFRFVTSTVTSPPLAGPNLLPTDTQRTNFTVRYLYRVGSGAQAGGERTNTASAVMTYPGYPQLSDVPLGPVSHTIQFEAPFTGGTMDKSVHDTSVNATVSTLGIPVSGQTRGFWWVDVYNTGNTPAVPVVTDLDLDQGPTMPVYEIGLRFDASGTATPTSVPGWTGTIAYTLDDGTQGTAQNDYTAPAGRRIVAATVTGDEIPGGRAYAGATDRNRFFVLFYTHVNPDAIPNSVHDNTASVTLKYPNYGLPDRDLGSDTAQVTLLGPTPTVTATLGTPTIAGGATQATPTSNVTFTVGGSSSSVAIDRDLTPQYVFMAPAGWNITPGSASFPPGSVPPGVSYQYRTVTVSGVDRQVVVATWPAGTVFGKNTTLPTMSVVARPGPTASAGTAGVPRGFIGNSATVQPGDIFTLPFIDAPDLDGDGDSGEVFSEAPAIAGVPVAAVGAMQVLKEICLPDQSQSDGCRWYADPDNQVGVPPNSTSIRYRLTVTNTGNTTLSDVVGYDVLPYIGDTGTSAATASTPRGSTIDESLQTITTPTNGATATFSASTQPCRPEVDPNVPGCANDWGSTTAGARAIRLSKAGALAPGTSFWVQYTAAVDDSPGFGAVGCNSFAVKASGLATVSEPAPVCAAIRETDLQIVAGTPHLQVGRPGILPWTVTNNGGAPSAVGEVVLHDIPAGLQVTSFTPNGWTCTATDTDGNPVYGAAAGPATLSCTSTSPLLLGVPVPLDIPVIATTTAGLTVPADVQGTMFDPALGNNHDSMQLDALAAAGDIGVTKDDGVSTASPGDRLTYTVTVTNPLDFETLTGAALTDTLPSGVAFVSASDGGTESGGVVTWPLPDIGGAATVTRTVTVTVLPTVSAASLTNTARVTAPDPANPSVTLTGTGTDVDTVATHPGLTLEKGSAEAGYGAVGDTIHYTFRATNTGDVTLTGVTITDPLAGLSAIAYAWPGTPGVLAPGDVVTATAAYTITQADIDATRVDNTATAAGDPPSGAPVSDDAAHRVTSTAVPHVTLTKTPSVSEAHSAGDVIDYTFAILNDGPITLDAVTIADALPGLSIPVVTWPGDPGVLAPGQEATATASYTVTQADVDAGEVLNTATATGRTPLGAQVSDDDSARVTIPAAPAITLVKRGAHAPGTTGHIGEMLDYTFTAENTGNTTLTGVTVSDPLPGLSDIAYTWPGAPGVLSPGQVVTATATYTVTRADVQGLDGVTNTVTVTGTPPAGEDVTAQDSVHLDTPARTGIQIEKTGALQRSDAAPVAGDVVDFTFMVTNLGDLDLHDVGLADRMAGLSAITYHWPGADGTLQAGQVMTAVAQYTLTQADIDAGSVSNTASTAGTPPTGDAVTDDDTATVVLPAAPALVLVKTATHSGAAAWDTGDVVSYRFTLTNTGNVTETGVTIGDPMAGLSAIEYSWPGAPGVLAPGQEVTATATYHLTSSDLLRGRLTNTATATSDQGASAEDGVTLIDQPAPPTPPATGTGEGSAAGAGQGPAPTAGEGDTLARTGSDALLPLLLAVVLLAAGRLLTGMGARRRRQPRS